MEGVNSLTLHFITAYRLEYIEYILDLYYNSFTDHIHQYAVP